jgi:membrane protein
MFGVVIVIGTEMNAEIEHASPWAKAPGEKVLGEKKRSAAAAARAYPDISGAPQPVSAPKPVRPAFEQPSTSYERLLAYVALAVRWMSRTKE